MERKDESIRTEEQYRRKGGGRGEK